MDNLNVQQFRDRTANYFRLMHVDKAACVDDLEKRSFTKRVEKLFSEAMEVQCKRANERDRSRFDNVLAKMERYLIDNCEEFEILGLCA